MEKNMICVSCSECKSKTINRADGGVEEIEWFDIRLTDGLDTILCDTNKTATVLIKAMEGKKLKVGATYSCRVKLSVRDFKREDGTAGQFFVARLEDIALVYA